MNAPTQSLVAAPQVTLAHVTQPTLQRACACGNHTSGGGECESCTKKRESQGGALQRKPSPNRGGSEGAVPSIVHDVLRSPGQPLDEGTRTFMEPRFGHDFSRVRIHTDARAAQSAAMLNAHAWTLGNTIAFASGQYKPSTLHGTSLLAHELTHVVQQTGIARSSATAEIGPIDDPSEHEAEVNVRAISQSKGAARCAPSPSPRLQRSFVSGLLDVLLFVPRLFGLEYFPAEDLRDYLAGLKEKKGPEDKIFSDNKARACVKREGELGPYDAQTKTSLVQEMLGGHTSFLDEGSIIDLMRRSADRTQIVAAVGRDKLWSKITGRNQRVVEALTLTAADAGDALVGRLRNLPLDQIQDYAANATDPAVRESVRRATALANITAPVSAAAAITPTGTANIVINGVRVIVNPDQINPAVGQHAFTHSNFQWAAPSEILITPQNANLNIGPVDPVDISVTIWTEYASEAQKKGSSGYGVGTRPEDEHTLQAHERAHGQGWFTFLQNNPPPAFTGAAGMPIAQFNAAVSQWQTMIRDYQRRAGEFALKAGDCVGSLPTDEQLAGTGFTAAICRND